MKTLQVEGWRGINHSYAIVNQWQLLELCRRPAVDLCHVDRPFFNAGWNAGANGSGFSAAQRQLIEGIRGPRPGEVPDVVLRIAFPFDVSPCEAGRVFVFGTAEYQHTDSMFGSGDTARAIGDERLSIVTPSHWSKAGFVATGFDPARVHVVSHGIDPASFRPIERKARKTMRNLMRVRNDDFVLLSVGAMTENKGIDLLLTAFARLRAKHRHLKLVLKDQSNLYGLTADRILAQLAASTNGHLFTEDVVSSIVFVSHNLGIAELAALYGAADCYVRRTRQKASTSHRWKRPPAACPSSSSVADRPTTISTRRSGCRSTVVGCSPAGAPGSNPIPSRCSRHSASSSTDAAASIRQRSVPRCMAASPGRRSPPNWRACSASDAERLMPSV